MDAETIIMFVFVGMIVVGLPILFYIIEREKKQEEQEYRKGNRK